MDYLPRLEGRNQSLHDRKICYEAINSNPVADFFKSQGYSFQNFGVFRFAEKLPYHTTPFYLAGTDLIRAQTLVSRLNRDIRFNLVTRFKISSEIARLAYIQKGINESLYQKAWGEIQQPTTTDPRFVYIHLQMPHEPYYFNSKGIAYPVDSLTVGNIFNQHQYLQYLQYGNNRYLKLIDHILKHAKQPPIVIFMSDHGYREYNAQLFGTQYQFMNINMVRLPGKDTTQFYKGMSAVNQFRVILNTAFKQQLPLLKDSTILLSE
jgi:hypothetical protein